MLFDGGRVSHPCSQFFWCRVICHMSLELPFDGYIKREECTSTSEVQGIHL